jgi:hypothetical protein
MVKHMSVTLLEFTVILILLIVAWQLGVAIAPWVIRRLRGLKDDIDEVVEDVDLKHTEKVGSNKEESRSNHNHRNN